MKLQNAPAHKEMSDLKHTIAGPMVFECKYPHLRCRMLCDHLLYRSVPQNFGEHKISDLCVNGTLIS